MPLNLVFSVAMATLTHYYPNMKFILRRWSLILLPGVVLGALFFSYMHFSETGRSPDPAADADGFITSMVIGLVLFTVLHEVNRRLDRWLAWKRFFATRFVTGYMAGTVVALGIIVGASAITITFFSADIFWQGASLQDDDVISKTIILVLCALFLYNVVYAILYSYQHYAVAQLETLQSERKQLELQFAALKAQVSPHYLFNSLNTISSLLFRDLPSAEQFIRRLAQTYQYILATQNRKFVLLKEEVEFVNSYYYLLRIRFQQQLDVEINLPASIMNSRIPPLTLQMLVENAVKHNNLSGDNKLFIYITAQDNKYLKVINTKTASSENASSFRVGLDNIRKRYAYFTTDDIFVKDDEKFTVSLPVLLNKDHDEQKFSA